MPNRRRPIVSIIASMLACLILLAAPWASSTSLEVYYSPEDQPLDRVIVLYERAARYIYVAVYGLTSPRAVEALVAAKRRGVDVRMITDQGRTEEPKQRSALRTLRLANIPIRVNRHDGLMHIKQVVIDDEINTTGSMNHTTSGNRYNDERVDIVRDRQITLKARDKFLAMWNDSARYRSWIDD